MIYKGKQLNRRWKTSLKPQAYDNPNKNTFVAGLYSLPFKAAVCGFSFWLFKINFLRFWSRAREFIFRNRGKKCLHGHLVREHGRMGLSPGGELEWPRRRPSPALTLQAEHGGQSRGSSGASQQPCVPWGGGPGPGVLPEDSTGNKGKALVWVPILLGPSLGTSCWQGWSWHGASGQGSYGRARMPVHPRPCHMYCYYSEKLFSNK